METRKTPGEYVPSGSKRDTWCCDTCGFQGSTATWKAPDGEEGLWCYQCKEKGTKSALKTVEVDVLIWRRGLTEVKCCGHWLECHRFTNTCACCHSDYNSSGQLLAPRSHWGEETGEQACDILDL